MADEVAQSPSQVKQDGSWRPIRHNTTPSIRSYPPGSKIPRRSSLRAFARKRPLAPIQEYKASSAKNRGTGSLEDLIPTYNPTSWKSSSDQLVLISESPQLQQIQSVSLSFPEDSWRYESAPHLYRTQSQWTRTSPTSRIPSGIPTFEGYSSLEISNPEDGPPSDASAIHDLDDGDSADYEAHHMCPRQHLPREDIAELFQRVEGYDRAHPEIVRDSGKVWVRVNSVSRGLSKTLKTMGSLHKKTPSFEARIGPNVPVYSQLKCYEKPGRAMRVKIVVHDCWRKLRNWSTGRDTDLQAKGLASMPAASDDEGFGRVPQNDGCARYKASDETNTLSKAPKLEGGWKAATYRGHMRKDSKHSAYDEPLKRRRSSLFPDVCSTAGSVAS